MPRDQWALDEVVRRASDPDAYRRWHDQARATHWCSHPVRLVGHTDHIDPHTGELVGRFTSTEQPDRVVLKNCGARRATSCPQCSAWYRSDAWHLLAAGLRGGKGTPETITTHPRLFVTLTAPSFGAVHSRREANSTARPCRPSERGRCPHGTPRACPVTHAEADPVLGEPICPDCFDYVGTILWNAHVTDLWRRTTIATVRALARTLGVTRASLHRSARLSYAKVVEYQRRGTVHLHVIIRVDGPAGPGTQPDLEIDTPLVAAALHHAVTHTAVPIAGVGRSAVAKWGPQIDIKAIDHDTAPEAVAGYLAKYLTKSTDGVGHLDHRLKTDDLADLDLPPHLDRLVRTAWQLGRRPELAHLRLQAWAHTLGFRGHWLTKSRQYSTTLGALRQARANWAAERMGSSANSGAKTTDIKSWQYAGTGWLSLGDAWLAETSARQAEASRRAANEERRERAIQERLDEEPGDETAPTHT